MLKEYLNHFLYHYFFPYAGLLFVKIISATYRITIINPENETDHVIYASWHQRLFPGLTFLSTRKPITIIISQSRDGEFVSKIVDILGWCSVRGSSTRGGLKALLKLKKLARSGYRVGHIVDGPSGPFGVVKPGLIYIAQITKLPIVPMIFSAQKKWTFTSWDRFMIPKPFSRVIYRFGDAIRIPEDLSEDEFEKKRLLVERSMKNLYEDTDLIWTKPDRLLDICK